MKPGEKMPDHLRRLDKVKAMVDAMTPQQRCAAARYHMLVNGVCECGFVDPPVARE